MFNRIESGQAMIEFAIVGALLIFVMLVGIQLAVIGNAALAVNQYSYSIARYASVQYNDSGLSSPNSDPAVAALIPPTIAGTDGSGNSLVSIALTPCAAAPNTTFGSTVTVKVSYDLVNGNKIFLPNPFTLLSSSGINWPTEVSATQSAFCE